MDTNNKISDIVDSWVEKGQEAKFIKEFDVVALHNWGTYSQIIGIAVVIWDRESHGWDYHMIAGNLIEDNYDKWRQCPRVIIDGTNHHTLCDECVGKLK